MVDRIRIATRESKLALWQANHVRHKLEIAHPGLEIEIIGLTTEGDRNKHSPLSQIGGKGVFVKELEMALNEGRADIAVHSMKDVPSILPSGLQITAMCEREDPTDAFVCNEFLSFSDLPAGSTVGSSSLRRRLQLRLCRPDLDYVELRGNVDTRLRKLDERQYDAIILASSGLIRLQLSTRISHSIAPEISIPAAGQGAVGIESRSGDPDLNSLLDSINHPATFDCVSCEREVSLGLGANCNLPIAAFAQLADGVISLQAYVSDAMGETFIRLSSQGSRQEAQEMARSLVGRLLSRGADKLIESHGNLN